MHGITRCYHKATSDPMVKICLVAILLSFETLGVEAAAKRFYSHKSRMKING